MKRIGRRRHDQSGWSFDLRKILSNESISSALNGGVSHFALAQQLADEHSAFTFVESSSLLDDQVSVPEVQPFIVDQGFLGHPVVQLVRFFGNKLQCFPKCVRFPTARWTLD
jgi:hypothetical protein